MVLKVEESAVGNPNEHIFGVALLTRNRWLSWFSFVVVSSSAMFGISRPTDQAVAFKQATKWIEDLYFHTSFFESRS